MISWISKASEDGVFWQVFSYILEAIFGIELIMTVEMAFEVSHFFERRKMLFLYLTDRHS